jgi:hypothetical protein
MTPSQRIEPLAVGGAAVTTEDRVRGTRTVHERSDMFRYGKRPEALVPRPNAPLFPLNPISSCNAAFQSPPEAFNTSGLRLFDQRFMVIQQAMGAPIGRGEAAALALRDLADDMKATEFVADSLAPVNAPCRRLLPGASDRRRPETIPDRLLH